MKVPVLYGSETGQDFSHQVKYITDKLGILPETVWDGNAVFDFPSTGDSIREELLQFIPQENISFEPDDRFLHSLGKSSPEILMAKHSAISRIVDAVIYPDYENISEILKKLLERKFHAIIFGGGTSVSGSLLVKEKEKIVSIDTGKFRKVEFGQGTATMGSGFTGAQAEAVVNRYGYTLGNFPESFIHSTIGGWVATKATGQESNQYGGIEKLTLGVTIVTSSGEISDSQLPRRSTGLEVKDVALGSDGRYGLITDVTMKLFPIPGRRYFSSRIFHTFQDGILALSRSKQFPSVARLSDELETEFAINGSGDSSAIRFYRGYLKARGFGNGALLVIVNNDTVRNPVLSGSMSGGSTPAKKWIEGRYTRPGIANRLWKLGMVPDTLETSTTWDNMYNLYSRTREKFYALKDELGFAGEIMAHLSHMYPTGACIYFTFIFKSDSETDTLERIRDGLVRAFTENGGAVTHHHGTGAFFRKYVDRDTLLLQEKLDDPLFRRND